MPRSSRSASLSRHPMRNFLLAPFAAACLSRARPIDFFQGGCRGGTAMRDSANRRDVLRGAGAMAIASLLPATAGCDASNAIAQDQPRPPNIVFILADDMG